MNSSHALFLQPKSKKYFITLSVDFFVNCDTIATSTSITVTFVEDICLFRNIKCINKLCLDNDKVHLEYIYTKIIFSRKQIVCVLSVCPLEFKFLHKNYKVFAGYTYTVGNKIILALPIIFAIFL